MIEVRPEIYHMITELRAQFAEMTDNPDLTDEDVIAVLINGFIESVEQSHHHHDHDGGCCGGHGDDCHCKGDKKDKGECGCGHKH